MSIDPKHARAKELAEVIREQIGNEVSGCCYGAFGPGDIGIDGEVNLYELADVILDFLKVA